MAKALQHEGNLIKHLINNFNFLPETLPDNIERDIESFQLLMVHNPIEIQVCGMFQLNYFILYAVRKSSSSESVG